MKANEPVPVQADIVPSAGATARMMLPYESPPDLPPEPPWKVVLSLCFGSAGVAGGVLLWWQTAPALWTLATFTPAGPIRPMGLVFALLVCLFGGFINGVVFAMPAAETSKRRPAQIVASLADITSMLPVLNFLLFFVIVFGRRLQLGD